MDQMNHGASHLPPPADSTGQLKRFSPLRFLAFTIGGIFLAEVVAMILLISFQNLPYSLQILLDASIMVGMIFPLIYFLSLRPLLHHIEKSKKAEQSLVRATELQERFFDSIDTLIAYMDRDFNFIRVNEAYAIVGGRPLEYFIGKNHFELYPHAENQAIFQRVVETCEAFSAYEQPFEYLNRPDCEMMYWNWSLQPVKRWDGSVEGVVLSMVDVTERKRAEEQLRIQSTAMEAAANGILITDPHGTILWTNPALSRMTSYAEDELLGQNPRLFKSGKHDADFYQQMWETILQGNVWQGEMTNRRKDGSLYVEEQTITPVRNESGQIAHFIAIKQDVTERKLMYAKLEDANRELTAMSTLEHQQRLLAEGLVKSSIVLNTNLELDSVLDHIFEQTRRIIPFLVADIVLVREGYAHVARQWRFEGYPQASAPPSEPGEFSLHEFPLWERIRNTRSTILIPDTGRETGWQPYFGMGRIRSYLAAPLIYGDQVIGIINVGGDQANTFTNDMAETLKAFAASAAVAIQNARLYEAEQQNRNAAELLSRASVALSQTLDIQHVMETVLDYVQLVLPLHVAFVVLSEADDRYGIRSVRTSDAQSLTKTFLNQSIDLMTEPLIRPFFEKETSTLIRDIRKFEEWTPPAELAFLRTWLAIPLLSAGKVMGLIVAANREPDSFEADQIRLAEAVVSQATVALQNAWLFEQVRAGRERLKFLSRRLVETQESERRYIARELHDQASQSLTSLILGLGQLEKGAGEPTGVESQVEPLKLLANNILKDLHRLAVDLRPASLDLLGLVPALEQFVKSFAQRSHVCVSFKSVGLTEADRLPADLESNLYRIVQEAMTNVVRHAKASHTDVILEHRNGSLRIIVEDNGEGFDPNLSRTDDHLGLLGMQERAEMLGGHLTIESAPGQGTTLVVEVPDVDPYPVGR